MDPNYCRPNQTCPVPLREDFWEVLVGRESQETNVTNPVPNADVVAEVGRIMTENSSFINKVALKEIAPTATNVEGNQYSNLIDLSFDQNKLLQEEEEKRKRQREKVLAKLLK
uniref:Stathmin n=1 Tax=Syphacia muris TaxID=451379 RepID=A0A0N5ARQ1_9BILA